MKQAWISLVVVILVIVAIVSGCFCAYASNQTEIQKGVERLLDARINEYIEKNKTEFVASLTPVIGTNGNWWIGDTDTGCPVTVEGQPGMSAYAVAVANGFQGTEIDWLNTLHGADGDTPYIGANKNWWIGDVDTGVSAHYTAAVNPNLLLNSNFQINQRGESSYTDSTTTKNYTVDRWCFSIGKAEYPSRLSVNSKNLSLSFSRQYAQWQQYLTEDLDRLKSQEITISANIENIKGDISFIVQIVQGSSVILEEKEFIESSGTSSLTFFTPENFDFLIIGLQKRSASGTISSCDVNWFKAEVGSQATQYSPPSISEELAKCQRYYYKSANLNLAAVPASETDTFYPQAFIPVCMRTKPKLSFAGTPVVRGEGVNLGTPAAFGINQFSTTSTAIKLIITCDGMIKFKCYALHNVVLIFDAEV